MTPSMVLNWDQSSDTKISCDCILSAQEAATVLFPTLYRLRHSLLVVTEDRVERFQAGVRQICSDV